MAGYASEFTDNNGFWIAATLTPTREIVPQFLQYIGNVIVPEAYRGRIGLYYIHPVLDQLRNARRYMVDGQHDELQEVVLWIQQLRYLVAPPEDPGRPLPPNPAGPRYQPITPAFGSATRANHRYGPPRDGSFSAFHPSELTHDRSGSRFGSTGPRFGDVRSNGNDNVPRYSSPLANILGPIGSFQNALGTAPPGYGQGPHGTGFENPGMTADVPTGTGRRGDLVGETRIDPTQEDPFNPDHGATRIPRWVPQDNARFWVTLGRPDIAVAEVRMNQSLASLAEAQNEVDARLVEMRRQVQEDGHYDRAGQVGMLHNSEPPVQGLRRVREAVASIPREFYETVDMGAPLTDIRHCARRPALPPRRRDSLRTGTESFAEFGHFLAEDSDDHELLPPPAKRARGSHSFGMSEPQDFFFQAPVMPTEEQMPNASVFGMTERGRTMFPDAPLHHAAFNPEASDTPIGLPTGGRVFELDDDEVELSTDGALEAGTQGESEADDPDTEDDLGEVGQTDCVGAVMALLMAVEEA